MAVTDVLGGPFTPPGFYYKTFIRPRRLWPVYEWVLRHAAGLGRLPQRRPSEAGGPSTAAATPMCSSSAAATPGSARRSPRPSSAPTWCSPTRAPSPAGGCCGRAATSRRARWPQRAREAGVEILCSAPALGHFDGLVPVWQGDTLHQVRARQHIYATGAIEQPLVFAGNDLPGRDALRRRAAPRGALRRAPGHAGGAS